MKVSRIFGAAWLFFGVIAAKDQPKITIHKFDSPQTNIFYFDDSEVLMAIDQGSKRVKRSTDAGENWATVDDIDEDEAYEISPHTYDNKVAVVVGKNKKHWITTDQGNSWRSFQTEELASRTESLSFHASDSKRILFHALDDCEIACIGTTYYTTDAFKTIETLHMKRSVCSWAKSEAQFTTGDSKLDKDMIVCIVQGRTPWSKDYKLVTTSDYFKNEHEPTVSNGRTVPGMINIAPVKGYIVAAAKAANSKEMALYVSTNAQQWHRAEFGDHKIEEDAYTVLESTNYSLQVDVLEDKHRQIGALWTSNSNGTYFTKNIEKVNRNGQGVIDFEKVQNIQGIVLVNQVDKLDDLSGGLGFLYGKLLKSKISFDDGRTWESMKVGDEELHLHSVTEQRNSGRIFSSPAPGILLGNGNTGEYLKKPPNGQLYVSDDAGRTWRETSLKTMQKYEFGDSGSVLLAVDDDNAIDEISYSLDHGRSWQTTELETKGLKVLDLTTMPDSTSLKFIFEAIKDDQYYLVAIDFAGLHERECKDGDFEKWYARVDDDGKPMCIMGHKQWFRRRKADVKCFINKEFVDPVPESEICDCTEKDFECDYNFRPSEDGKDCEQVGNVYPSEGQCKKAGHTFKGTSGYRLIPGNDCKRTSGKQKDDEIDRKCDEALSPPAGGTVDAEKTDFPGRRFEQIYYLERDEQAQGNDETIVMLTNNLEAYITHNHGKTWKKAVDDEVVSIYPHVYNNNYVYFITPSNKVYYSEDRGKAMHSFEVPEPPNILGQQIMSFHPKNHDWIIWTGGRDCKGRGRSDPACHNVAHVSRKNGEDWQTLLRWVEKCQFMYREGRPQSEDLIFCEQYQGENRNNKLQLISTEDDFSHPNKFFDNVVNFASMSEFIVVASKDEDKQLHAQTSINGKSFAYAAWPPNFKVDHETAYTVLDSSTHSIFMHVTVNANDGRAYGSLLKSNSNGTSYVLSLDYVNRNDDGYVDFEKMQGLEGVALVNVVDNGNEVDNGGRKKIKTKITHDDGADWAFMPPPKSDLDGRALCSGEEIEKCSLHLHGYTERRDPRDTYSSPSAIGLMVGIGNVGEYLGNMEDGDTFLTSDGGITWRMVQRGIFLWEYGDQGAIIVLVERDVPSDTVVYSTDEGNTWLSHKFSDTLMNVERITTVPSDNSRNFLLWGKDGGKLTTVNIDFTDLTDRQCNLDKEHPDSLDSDYDLWSPQHPLKTEEKDCLFGHKALYYRKKIASKCYNGPMIEKLHGIERNCACTRQDFECDYNYQRQTDGSCKLVEGLQPMDPKEVCLKNPDVFEYYEPTGYRKIPISTCAGGKELQYAAPSHPCPGHEDEYERKKGASGVGVFFAVVIPVAAAAAIGYWVWKNWDGKFGQIRLGDATAGGGENPFIKYPVAALSAIVAVAAAIPLLVTSLFRSVRNMFPGGGASYNRVYNSRSSFARGGQDYDVVDDEGELLGEDSDEEV